MRICDVDAVALSSINGGAQCEIAGFTAHLPFCVILGRPKAKVQRVNDENPLNTIFIIQFRVMLKLGEICHVQLLANDSCNYLWTKKRKLETNVDLWTIGKFSPRL